MRYDEDYEALGAVKVKKKAKRKAKKKKFRVKNRLFTVDDIEHPEGMPKIDEEQEGDGGFSEGSVATDYGDGNLRIVHQDKAKKSFSKIFTRVNAFRADHAMGEMGPVKGAG